MHQKLKEIVLNNEEAYEPYSHNQYLEAIDSRKAECSWYIPKIELVHLPILSIPLILPIKIQCRYLDFGSCSFYADSCTRKTPKQKQSPLKLLY